MNCRKAYPDFIVKGGIGEVQLPLYPYQRWDSHYIEAMVEDCLQLMVRMQNGQIRICCGVQHCVTWPMAETG